MTFMFAPAVRDRVGLIIGIAGASGSGKSLSGLKIARGLAGGDDSRIAAIDTEAGRLKHYAPGPGERPSADRFGFAHGDLRAPFSPDAYIDAVVAADNAGFEVIMVDSFSHEFEGDGGLHDMHDAILDEQVEAARKAHTGNWQFDEAKTRERLSIGAWNKPKTRHKRLVSRLLQCRAHLVICMRAEEKMRMEQVEDDRGRKRTVITQAKDLPPVERWMPICEKRLPYEFTLSVILAPTAPGVPMPIKLQEQHRPFVPLDRPLSEDVGRGLAAWARGGAAPPAAPALSGEDIDELVETGRGRAEGGTAALQDWFTGLTRAEKLAVKPAMDAELKGAAAKADKEREAA